MVIKNATGEKMLYQGSKGLGEIKYSGTNYLLIFNSVCSTLVRHAYLSGIQIRIRFF